jgi:hypothetical protein
LKNVFIYSSYVISQQTWQEKNIFEFKRGFGLCSICEKRHLPWKLMKVV